MIESRETWKFSRRLEIEEECDLQSPRLLITLNTVEVISMILWELFIIKQNCYYFLIQNATLVKRSDKMVVYNERNYKWGFN